MKSKVVLIWVGSSLLLIAGNVDAQQSGAVKGGGQTVAVHLRAPEKARWWITLNPKKDVESATEGAEGQGGGTKLPFEQRVQVTKQGQVIFEQVFFGNGKRHEKWCVGEFQYPIASGVKMEKAVAYTRNSFTGTINPLLFTDYSKSDFPGAEWLEGKTPKGQKKILGRECLVFNEGEKTAYVDVGSLYPVVLHDSGKTWLVEFQATPPGNLTLPPLIAKDQQERAEYQARIQGGGR